MKTTPIELRRGAGAVEYELTPEPWPEHDHRDVGTEGAAR